MTMGHTLFVDLFTYVLLFDQTHLQGEFQPSYEQVCRDIGALFQQEKATAKRQGMLDKDFQDAGFAVVAWADETILKHTTWKYHHEWNTHPLQLEYYQTRNAGEEFFERLQQLGAAQQAVREVYYLCLALDFSGQYFLGLEDELKLTQMRHEQARHLTLPVESVQDIEKITAQPYEVHPPTGRPVTYPLTHLLLQAGLVLLVTVPLVFFGLKTCGGPSAPLQLDAKSIQKLLPQQPCAKVSVAVQGGVVELGGRVVSANQGADIRKIVESVKGVTQVTEKFEIIPRPFCAVLDLLEPIKKQAEDRGINLVTKLNKDGNIPDYYDKENLAITGKIPINFGSYIYVDYYAADGNVGHLLPSPQQKTNRLASNQSFAVPDGRYEQKISADPPGLELITIISSKTSLFPVPRNNEPADVYLNELRQVLSKEKVKPDVTATFHFIRTNRETSASP
jgi:type IV/VI secretion system ImpK/VasF family protein